MFVDSELNKLETELIKRDKWFHAIIENINGLVVIIDENGIVKYSTPWNEKFWGYKEEDNIGKNGFDFIHPDDLSRTLEIFSELKKAPGNSALLEIRYLHHDSTWHYVEVCSKNYLDDPDIFGIVVAVRDVTERRLAEAMLIESESRFRLLTEGARDIIYKFRIKPYYGFEYVSPSIIDITGYNPDDYYNDHDLVFKIIYPDDKPLLEKYIKESCFEKSIVLRWVRKDGQIIWTESKSVLIYDNSGDLVACEGITRDITDRRKLHDEMLKTEKLKSIGILAGGIAHDFNNIMTTIIGNISLAKMYTVEGDRIRDVLKEAEKGCNKARDLTQQLLAFARGGSPVKKLCSIKDVVVNSTEFAISGSNLYVKYSLPDNLWDIEADKIQISQVVNNLILNAKQSMPDGGRIDISAENFTINTVNELPLVPGNYIKISVRDYGPGIAEEYIDKIFDPYFTTKKSGSGLGLAIVYTIIKNHKGYVTVESSEGAGTTFHVYLPVTDDIVEF
jgi:PAS domain S-box-containing protein